MKSVACWALLWGVLGASPARAGNLPVFYDGNAGPYRLRVRIDPPDVIPGMARIEIRSDDSDITGLRLLALPIDSERRAYPPAPDVAEPVGGQTAAFTGRLWLMRSGSWEVRLLADGLRGAGELAVPVAALPTHVTSMPLWLGLILLCLLAVLALGMVSIAAAAVREGQLAAGQLAGAKSRQRSRIAGWGTAGVVLAIVILGGLWWSASDRAYARSIYRPLTLEAQLEPNGKELALTLGDPGWLRSRKLDDLVRADGHAMDLWVLEIPGLEHVWHLHPAATGSGRFEQILPQMNPGRYALFATVVHADGLQETARAEVTLPAVAGEPLGTLPVSSGPRDLPSVDDATGQGGSLGSFEALVAALPGGGRVRLEASDPPVADKPTSLRFHVEERAEGQPARNIELVEGRRAEGILVSGDLRAFETLSSRGTVAPAAWAIANPDAGEGAEPASPDFTLDCDFANAGSYRLFLQLRRGGRDEIAIFDLRAR